MCPRCEADPQPPNFGNPRQCAFGVEGNFTPDNWACATLSELFRRADEGKNPDAQLYGDDETLQAVYAPSERPEDDEMPRGWIVMTRYKTRGCCSSAVHVGDFWPPVPLTLEIAERWLV